MTRDQVIAWLVERLPKELAPFDAATSLILVSPAEQTLDLFPGEADSNRQYPISTARNGLGNLVDSFQTPIGAHRIAEKIGADEPSGMVFRGRRPVGSLATDMNNQSEDQITSRILWLTGLEPGVNQGGDCDSFQRYIYIHGTSDEQRIGEPVSAGCIRMRNDDVIELFDQVDTDTLVLILGSEQPVQQG